MSSEHTIAIVGASTNRRKYGNIAVRAYRDQGWRVYPVNPRAETIEELPAFASIRDVPEPLERVSVYLPPAVLLGVLEDIAPDTRTKCGLIPALKATRYSPGRRNWV